MRRRTRAGSGRSGCRVAGMHEGHGGGTVRNLAAICVVVSSVASLSAQDPRPTMTVGTASAARGKTAYGEIAVPAGSDAATSIAVSVVHGAKPGKIVAF